MQMYVYCLGCDAKLEVGEELFGKTCQCSNCGEEIAIPYEEDTSFHTQPSPVDLKPREKNTQQPTSSRHKSIPQPTSTGEYKTPLLSIVFRINGFVSIVIAIFALIAWIVSQAIYQEKQNANIALYTFIGALSNAVISFGIAKMLEYIAKIAYHAEKTCNHIERFVNGR